MSHSGGVSAPPPTTPTPTARRALGAALLSGALGAAVVLVAAGQVWGEAATAFARGRLPLRVTGSDVSGLPSALAMVGLAALVAVFAVRRAGRTAVAALLALCGVGTVVAAVRGAADTAALRAQAAEVTGLAGSSLSQTTHTAWPWLSAGGGCLLALAGVLALVYGRHWPAMSGRYERASARSAPARSRAARRPVAERPEDLWRALDRGEDPTAVEDAAPDGRDGREAADRHARPGAERAPAPTRGAPTPGRTGGRRRGTMEGRHPFGPGGTH